MNWKSTCCLLLFSLMLFGLSFRFFEPLQAQTVSEPVPPPPPERPFRLVDGDIMVPHQSPAQEQTQAGALNINLWPDGIVPYYITPDTPAHGRDNTLSAMAEIMSIANVQFVPWDGHANYLYIKPSTGNSSYVGMIGGGQTVNIFNWSYKYIIAHELYHALGFQHEHSRLDRDLFVQINDEQVSEGYLFAFDTAGIETYPKRPYGLPDAQTYDFASIMHYGPLAFSKNGQPTITVLPPNQAFQSVIGNRSYLSELDKLTLSLLYPPDGWTFVDSTHDTPQNGTFLQPHRTFQRGMRRAPAGGTLMIQPGTYSATGVYNKPMVLDAPLGHVVLGP